MTRGARSTPLDKEAAATAPTFAIPDPVPFDRLLSLKGRCAVVTGGSRGIGEAIVLRLAEAGASVIVTARGQEGLAKVEAKVAAMVGKPPGFRRMQAARRTRSASSISRSAGSEASIFWSTTLRCSRPASRSSFEGVRYLV